MRILETAIYAANLAETAAFYETVLGLERFSEVPGRHVFFRVEGAVLLIFRPEATRQPPAPGALPVPPHGPEGPGHVCFAASLAEIGRWRDRLEAAGVGIESDFQWPQGGRSIYFRDPAGNSVELAEPRIWGL
ncbi:VOC family protein [Limibaculum sp. FT325]|uniref:VOC family protein n=1 Tax=Thermohalobaculum sediminis TaxID=2939436 RepID=UPI0020C09239|nr:VOC family protein [Limibaculum sediminis]MCL5777249.1 VOC family protein [Limibaculum sediminis]